MRHRWLVRFAWLNVVTHLVASAALAIWLRRGLIGPGVPSELEAVTWITLNPTAWAVGWGCWHVAALAFLGTVLMSAVQKRPREAVAARVAGWFAVLLVFAGLAADLSGQWLMIAAGHDLMGPDQLLKYRIGLFMSGAVGNLGYSLGLLLLTASWVSGWRTWTKRLGLVTGMIGVLVTPLSIRSADVPWAVAIATALLMVGVIAWSVALAREPNGDHGA